MRPAWDGIAGWVLMVLALVLALVIPYPHNGLALIAAVVAVAGGALVAQATSRPQKRRARR